MFQKNVLIFLIFSFILLIASNMVVASENEKQAEIAVGVNLTDSKNLDSIFDFRFDLKSLDENFNLGFNGYYLENGFSIYDLYSFFNLEMIKKYNTSLEMGLSNYNNKKKNEVYKGFSAGLRLNNNYSQKLDFFSNFRLSVFPGKILPRYETGIKYKINDYSKINLSYKKITEDFSGLNIGISLEIN
ncbi:MAG: hypothetical protein ACQEQF_06670 [Bacillota bacterium]